MQTQGEARGGGLAKRWAKLHILREWGMANRTLMPNMSPASPGYDAAPRHQVRVCEQATPVYLAVNLLCFTTPEIIRQHEICLN